MIPSLKLDLNKEQQEAAETIDGPLLILAGAGTGKTRVLIARIAHILATGRAYPNQLLAVTFTNKAAQEMKSRVAAVLQRPVEGWWLGTFHSLSARLLRRHAELVGLTPQFTILDEDDQQRLIKQLLQSENIDDQKLPARQVAGIFSRWKDKGLFPSHVQNLSVNNFVHVKLPLLYAAYQERLKNLNCCDFGDLLLHNLQILGSHPDVLGQYHQQFRFLMVDEYQDTNTAQYLWIRLLSQKHQNLCCVGDDDQSIYGWRGAEIGNILKFSQDFPTAKIVRLEQNYRSTPHILAAASGIISHNKQRMGKTLHTNMVGGDKVQLGNFWDGTEEARYVAEEIEALQRRGHSLGAIAILVRTGAQTREFEERFLTFGIKYRVIGGPRFYERLEIRDALAYLRLVYQPRDDLAFERIINKPRRGIGDTTIRLLYQLAKQHTCSLTEAAKRFAAEQQGNTSARRSIASFMSNFERWRALSSQQRHTDLARLILDESGYTEMWQKDPSPDSIGRLENLKELISAMEQFDNLAGFLEHVSLVMENAEGNPEDMVTIMTLHSAKGLEFNILFLPGWEEGLFPHQRALDETGNQGLEEERRLAYVGITRARQRLYITYANSRRLYGLWQHALPSRFIWELPKTAVEPIQTSLLAEKWNYIWAQKSSSQSAELVPEKNTRPIRQPLPFLQNNSIRGDLAINRPTVIGTDKKFLQGDKVFHQKFGYGIVLNREGEHLEIAFDKAGTKKVMAAFLVAANVAG
ncbi:MAG: UvrD-helicase domain-containing protein [Rhodospirillaceae bacterium]|nr:UvrD-helicase domain-containing protein [Rhodospirillaceae bacterium]